MNRMKLLLIALQSLAMMGLLGLTACVTNEATGRSQFVGMMGASQEAEIGAAEHPKILEAFGGVYDDIEVGAYIAEIGGRLSRNSEMPNVNFRFTVLDTPTVNAFALPGGYVYVTRGLLALANSEAEIAAVIGHEIGHVTGRHTSERYGRSTLAGLGGIAAAVLGATFDTPIVGDLYNTAAAGFLAGFSRSQEYESDMLGIRYLSRTGYDPFASGDFLANLGEEAVLQRKLAFADARDPGRDFFATHPQTEDRVRRAHELAREASVSGSSTFRNRNRYLDVIDAMIYGDSPEQGFIQGRRFSHPQMRFTYEVPEGFRLTNAASAVVARSERPAIITLEGDNDPGTSDPVVFLTSNWLKDVPLSNVARRTINGLSAASAEASVAVDGGQIAVYAVSYRLDSGMMLGLLFLATPAEMQAQITRFEATATSLRALSPTEAAALKPKRIAVVTVQSGDTVSHYARRMAFDDFREERFRTLNSLGPNDGLRAGEKVKIVTE